MIPPMKAGKKGFTLVEIMITVVIIGLLASFAIPHFYKARMNASFARFMNDVRVFASAVEQLYLESGVKPTDTGTGTIQDELAEYVRAGFFTRESPIGGHWDVEADDSGIGLGVGVDGYTISRDELLELDKRFDDGNLQTGRLVEIVANRRYYWVIEL
jgi:prepilin-type N-terminal cleavage/methylation domain-containing protein